jgi:hypothetical protein
MYLLPISPKIGLTASERAREVIDVLIVATLDAGSVTTFSCGSTTISLAIAVSGE